MAFKDEKTINFDKLEEELQAAVDADARYWRENAAKFRAIEQKVPTYEEFRDIVSASHLKPLEKGDRISDIERFTQPWNTQANRNKDGGMSEKPSDTALKDTKNLPKNGIEFARDWKRHCTTAQERYQFLLTIGPDKLSDIFKAEISCGLGEILTALLCHTDKDVITVVQILEVLSAVKRFGLSLDFLGSAERENCTKLFTKLSEHKLDSNQVDFDDKISTLRTKYGIKLEP